MKKTFISLFLIAGLLMTFHASSAHCDTKDGPVVLAAKNAIKHNNINYALIWVTPAFEKEVKEAFESTMKVRILNDDAEKLADNYFFETLVRLHRLGEGMAYTGIKPSGTPVGKEIVAADKSIALGNLSPLYGLIPPNKHTELKKYFEKVMSLKNYDTDNISAGREYIEAYVQFFHFAEGKGVHNSGSTKAHKH